MAKNNLIGYTLSQMESLFVDLEEKKYRGKQLYKWLYCDRLYDFDRMTNFSKDLRSKLADRFDLRPLKLVKKQKSEDGTEKFLFELEDGLRIESVLVQLEDRRALCVSSQVGCALDCRFCATGTMGFQRNLTMGEILGQIMHVRDYRGEECFANIVFMGMGEPLNNYDSIVEVIHILTDSMGFGIGAKRIVVSTAGVVPKIRQLADSGLKARLAVSLNAATQAKRLQIMPVTKGFPLHDLMDAIRYYTGKTGTRVTFEYILMEDFNDTLDDVLALARIIEGIPCKINLLAYNPVEGLDYRRPNDDKVDWFARQLFPRAPAVTVRKSRGRDIDAACGQLVAKNRR